MVSSEWGFREIERNRMCQVKSLCVSLPSSAKVGSSTCPPPPIRSSRNSGVWQCPNSCC